MKKHAGRINVQFAPFTAICLVSGRYDSPLYDTKTPRLCPLGVDVRAVTNYCRYSMYYVEKFTDENTLGTLFKKNECLCIPHYRQLVILRSCSVTWRVKLRGRLLHA
jgi:hypothetical protein